MARKLPLQKLPEPWQAARPGRPLVISHRAGANEAPENTLAALRNAQKAGSKIMQMDVLPTADGTPVVFHDINMSRVTGVDVDIRTVRTADLPSYKGLLEPLLQAGSLGPLETANFKDGSRIPLLREVLEEAAAKDTYIILEIWDENKALVEEVVRLLRATHMQDRVILGNPINGNIWRHCMEALPTAPTILPLLETYKLYFLYLLGLVWLWRPPPTPCVLNVPLFTGWESFLKNTGQTGMRVRLGGLVLRAWLAFSRWLVPRPGLFMWLQEHGIPVVLFILNRPQDWEAALSLQGVTAIQTDNPTALIAYLKKRSPQVMAEPASAASKKAA